MNDKLIFKCYTSLSWIAFLSAAYLVWLNPFEIGPWISLLLVTIVIALCYNLCSEITNQKDTRPPDSN